MKVSKLWLKDLVDLSVPIAEVERLLPIRTIAIKEFTSNYFELDMKGYNRSDLLSLRGVANEVAAITNSKTNFNETDKFIWEQVNLPEISVQVENQELAPLYCLAKIEGLKVAPSETDWLKKLEDSGMRAVNNIADVTNLVMLEYGQPLHAFDAQKVKDEQIIVRTVREGEELITLDGKKRQLITSNLLITDPEKPLGLAGVMGGKNSEVTADTSTILLEAAIFNPVNIRTTAQQLRLPSEASKRFQHGLTEKRLFQALDAAIKMYQQLGGKLTAITIVGKIKSRQTELTLTQNKINSLIGVITPPGLVVEILEKLHFNVTEVKQGVWKVVPPYWRLDIEVEEDLIEEIARIYGYEQIPATPLQDGLPAKINQSLFHLIYNIKAELVQTGLTEIQTYSFYSTDVTRNLNISREKLVKIANPMSKETEYMRDSLWPNTLEAALKNLKTREDLAVFEVGKVYQTKTGGKPEEKYKLAIALSSNTTESIQELFSIFAKLAEKLNWQFKIGEGKLSENNERLFHPVRYTTLTSQNTTVGFIAEIHPRVTDFWGINKRIAILEVDLGILI